MKDEFEVPIPPSIAEIAQKATKGGALDKDVDLKTALAGLAVPNGFDPAKEWSVVVVGVTISARQPFQRQCNGWLGETSDRFRLGSSWRRTCRRTRLRQG